MFWEIMNQHLSVSQYLDFFVRLLVACCCGAIIGMERGRRLKEAGIRTHVLVCCTAALFIIVSKYGFADLTDSEATGFLGVRGADPARIAAQVVSGISFLCAGVIFKHGTTVKGLTTAAGLWATAGIGLAIGAGMYLLGIFVTILILVFQIIMHLLPTHNDQYQINHIEFMVANDTEFRSALTKQITKWQAQIMDSSIKHNQDGSTTYSLEVRMNNNVSTEEILAFLEQNSSISYSLRTTSN